MSVTRDPRNGDGAYVNKKHRLEVEATTADEALKVAEDGDAYNINTGLIGISNSTVTPLLYFKNQEDHEIVIQAIAIGMDDLGTHTGSPVFTLVRNPISVDFSAAVDMNQNRNFASTKSLKSTTLAYKGAAGDTVTGGDAIALFLQQKGGRLFAPINFVVGVGNSLCITGDLQVTGDTCQVYVALVIYAHEDID
jgi:hypothetical protein